MSTQYCGKCGREIQCPNYQAEPEIVSESAVIAAFDRALDIATIIATQHQFTGHGDKKCGEPGALVCGLEIAARIQERKLAKGPTPRPSAAESDSDSSTPTEPPTESTYELATKADQKLREAGYYRADLVLGQTAASIIASVFETPPGGKQQ